VFIQERRKGVTEGEGKNTAREEKLWEGKYIYRRNSITFRGGKLGKNFHIVKQEKGGWYVRGGKRD